jgi:DNA polymerase-3 subunit alpha
MKFTHLRIHTEFSLKDSLIKIQDLVGHEQHNAYAITDDVNLYGAIKHFKKARGAGKKPIIGAEINIKTNYGYDKVALLCKSLNGYRNLMSIISESYNNRENKDGMAFVELSSLINKKDDMIMLVGGHNTLLFNMVVEDSAKAAPYINELKSIFSDDLYIELQRIGLPNEAKYISGATTLAVSSSIPVVATNAVRFLEKKDFTTHEVRHAISEGKKLLNMRQSASAYTPEQYLKSEVEMIELFSDIPSAIQNTVTIARKCNLEIPLGKIDLPDFPVEDGHTDDTYLEKLSREGLEKRLSKIFPDESERNKKRKEYDDRLARELGVVKDMGFPGYFLIVMEFIQWSKANDIPVGPGRGSGAGSLIAYSLDITDLDPMEYDLLFERFLNPERVSMPDFDIDFCKEGRDKVIDHVAEVYGRESVSQIITFGTMAARMVVKDVSRALGYPYSFGNRISRLIPTRPGIKLQEAIHEVPALKILVEEDPQVAEVFEHSLKLEGMTRQVGKHAGGVLISPTIIDDYSPRYRETNTSPPVSQFDKDDVEDSGLVKFDFLGLKTLTVLKKAKDLTAQSGTVIDLSNIPLNDEATFKVLKDANTTGVFQLESSGMKNLITRLVPENFEEIIALVALFRPGPLDSGMVDTFINCKKGIEKIAYPHESLEQILDVTYGVFVYQEQVMQAAQIMAGFSLGQADLLRRAMGKKKPEEMAKQRVMFVDGSVENNIDKEQAGRVFDLMETFAGYGFNKSHSAAYALISIHTAYMKAHHTAEFFAATLTSDAGDQEKVVRIIHDLKENNVGLMSPSINYSESGFSVRDNKVVYGLGAIKGFGDAIVEKIVKNRESNGEFKNLFDFTTRVYPSVTVVSAGIFSGAFDDFGHKRKDLYSNHKEVVLLARKYRDAVKNKEGHEVESVYDEYFKKYNDLIKSPEVVITDHEVLIEERKRLGMYLSSHPCKSYTRELENLPKINISEVADISGEDILRNIKEDNGKNMVKIAGAIVDMKLNANQRGHSASITVDDGTAQIKVRVDNKLYNEVYHLLNNDTVISMQMGISYNPNSNRRFINAFSIDDMNMVRQKNISKVLINIDLNNDVKKSQLKSILKNTEMGSFSIEVNNTGSLKKEVFKIGQGRAIDDIFIESIESLSGEEKAIEYVMKNDEISNEHRNYMKKGSVDHGVLDEQLKRLTKSMKEAREEMGLAI